MNFIRHIGGRRVCALRALWVAAALVIPSVASAAIEDPPDPDQPSNTFAYFEDDILVRSGEVIQALGPDLMGDRINESVGGLEFNQTDVSLPGNNKLEVRVGRRLVASAKQVYGTSGLFGDWDLDIPHLYTVAADGDVNWYGGSVKTNFNRCSQFAVPPFHSMSIAGQPELIVPESFWDGYHLYVPGQGEQTLLLRNGVNTNIPTDGAAYPAVTKQNWALRCLSALDNGAGEGFEAISPDGTRYRFDHMAIRPHANVRVKGRLAQASLTRKQVWLLPTQITDRFGNWVRYAYTGADGWRVSSITSSDGRSISITYNGIGNRIQSVTDGTRTWTYAYGGAANTLQTVTLPDQSQWRFSLDAALSVDPRSAGDPMCDSDSWDDLPITTLSMTHPSGALGTFTLQRTIHGRTAIPVSGGSYCHPYNKVPRFFSTRSLKLKTLSGPGMPAQNWSYAYSEPIGLMAPCNGCINYKTVTITDPEGDVTANTYGTQHGFNEGLLLSSSEGVSGSTSLRTTAYAYAPRTTGPYPVSLGGSMVASDAMSSFYAPQSQRVITQQGVTFTQTVTTFDGFARPTGLTRTSTPGTSRSESMTYHDHTSLWVLGQLASRTVAGMTAVSRTFNASAQPASVRKFGKLQASYGYNPDGTLLSVTDGLNKSTTFANYKRGLPQLVTFADGKTISAVVNNIGTLDSVTNEAGSLWRFGYDAMGRLNRKIYPTGDPVAYLDTTLSFVQVPSAEVGLEANHWRQTITTGNAVTINYFDARWRKRLTWTYDSKNLSATQRMQRFDYDTYNRTTFASYPARSIASIAASVPGTATAYDALGRVTQTQVNSELGLLTATTQYLTGFQKRVTDARGKVTTTGFQAFDEPDESAITSVAAPEGMTVTIARDLLDKPTAITRSGTYAGAAVSAKRQYVYDTNQLLCKTIEPETGATIQQLDAANNVSWRATGLNLPSITSCDLASVPAASKVAYTYDARHRLTGTGFADGSPAIGRTYTPDGLPATVTSDGPTWTYTYNKRRLLTQERLAYNAATYDIKRSVDAYGHLSQLTYPIEGAIVAYAPNALGEPTMVGSYATGVTYHPNGAVAGYTLGNAIVHTLSQNTRGLPLVSQDVGVLKDLYGYDANGNVTAITDQQESIASRAMAYDGLDRLITANSAGVWGNASFSYDPLGNVRTSVVGSRSSTHAYGSNNLLASVTSNGVATAYMHDARGNVSKRGSQAYIFDQGNRLNSASGVASYTYDGWGRRVGSNASSGTYRTAVYSQDGQLLYGQAVQGSKSWTTRHIYLQGKLIAETDSTLGTRYAHTDALGSPVAWTNASKVVTSRTRYEPYGKTAAGTNPGSDGFVGVGFTGHVNDAATGLVYMQQRYYDPVAGRFLSVDPITTDANKGTGFNRYEYGNNNPYKYKDPDGQVAQVAAIGAGVLLVGSAVCDSCRQSLASGTSALASAIGRMFNQSDSGTEQSTGAGGKAPPLPGGLVGAQDNKSGPQGNRHNSGPLSPENGGTGDAGKDFDKLTGGKSGPAPEGSGYPKGTQVGENGVALRPEGTSSGPRIDVPANGEKPHETLHYPKGD